MVKPQYFIQSQKLELNAEQLVPCESTSEQVSPREAKGDREGIPHTHPIPQVIRLELFLESG